MIKNSKKLKVEHANGDILHRVIYESPDCPDPDESLVIVNKLFQTFAQTPQLTMCGLLPFQTMTMKFVNSRWVVEFQALEVKGDTV